MAPPILLGTYAPPALRKGDRATCFYRDAECVVTSWTEAPIPRPRFQPIEHRDGSGLLVDETILRAIPHGVGQSGHAPIRRRPPDSPVLAQELRLLASRH